MIDLGPHAGFIVWAYLGTGGAIAGLILYRLFDARRVARRLVLLEAAHGRRRGRQ